MVGGTDGYVFGGPLETAILNLGVPLVPVFLRWLIADLIVRRILRHRRVRPYVDRAYPVATQYVGRFGRRVYPPMVGGYRYVRRRRLGCCSGCFVMAALAALALLALLGLLHWTFSL